MVPRAYWWSEGITNVCKAKNKTNVFEAMLQTWLCL